MAKYFSYFPQTSYLGQTILDISARSKFVEETFNDPYVFLPYTVREGERPEDVAYLYYGNVDATWIVLLANQIVDPYHDWVMTSQEFEQYMIKKYATQSGLTGFDVLAWTQNETIDDNVLFYYKTYENGEVVKRSPESFPTEYETTLDGLIVIDENDKPIVVSRTIEPDWIPVRVYEFEFQMNENKREIRLIEDRFYQKTLREFKATMNR